MNPLLTDLQSKIANNQTLIIVGAGISVGATKGNEVASWEGLLKHGMQYCKHVAKVPKNWDQINELELENRDTASWISVAERISVALGGSSGGEFASWLENTVGQLKAEYREVIEALGKLEAPIATTNYDFLLEDVLGLPPITWKEYVKVQRAIRKDRPGVIHLHGHWEDPESIVFGNSSYQKIMHDEHAQHMQKVMGSVSSLLYVGFGAGLNDPNFDHLLKWTARLFSGSPYRNFRLARESEIEDLKKANSLGTRLLPLSYGPDYSDLGPFLTNLTPKKKSVTDINNDLLDACLNRIDWDSFGDLIRELHSAVNTGEKGDSQFDFDILEIQEKNKLNKIKSDSSYFQSMVENHEPHFREIEEFLEFPPNEVIKDIFSSTVDALRQIVALEQDAGKELQGILTKLGNDLINSNGQDTKLKGFTINCLISFLYFRCDLGRKK